MTQPVSVDLVKHPVLGVFYVEVNDGVDEEGAGGHCPLVGQRLIGRDWARTALFSAIKFKFNSDFK